MAAELHSGFAELLRDARLNAGLTQEELAEAAGVSARAISNLERGINRYPHRHTRDLLADALEISPEVRKVWDAACRRQPASAPSESSATENSESSHVHRAPVPPTRLIGRDTEVEDLYERIRQPGVRLLTITGSGGVGKTRLSLGLIEALQEEFPDGVYFVDLATVRDHTLVDWAIASAIGLQHALDQSLQETFAAYLRFRRALLVIDNFEHVIDAAPIVSDLLARCPMLKVLVTSRAALHLHGEHEVALSPLALPGGSDESLEKKLRAPAVALFAERARMAKADFAVDAQNVDVVVAICRRLDGIPLAIELAAARIKVTPPRELLERLDRPLELLTSGARDAPDRQRTLRDTIAWSYGLLSPDEQRLLSSLSVFVGGFSLSAAEGVCEVGTDVLASMEKLIDHSLLIQRESHDGTARFWMLETVREFGLEQLEQSGEYEQARERHARYVLRLVEEAKPELRQGPHQPMRLRQMQQEFENIRVAFTWLVEHSEAEAAARLIVTLGTFFQIRKGTRELREWIENVLTLENAIEPGLKGDLLALLGMSFNSRGQLEKASEYLERSIELCLTANNKTGLWQAYYSLANVERYQGYYDQAGDTNERALSVAYELNDRMLIGQTLGHLSLIKWVDSDFDHAKSLSSEYLRLATEVDDYVGRQFALAHLGHIALYTGDLDTAEQRGLECLHESYELDYREMTAFALELLGQIELERSNFERTQRLHRQSIEGFWRSQGTIWRNLSICELASAAAGLGDYERGARLLGVAQKIYDQLDASTLRRWTAHKERLERTVRSGLDETTFEEARAEGRSWPLEQGLAYALGITDEHAHGSRATLDHVSR
jgi:predicted ATPase/transcriptional regulator with XRE-family HTH domain